MKNRLVQFFVCLLIGALFITSCNKKDKPESSGEPNTVSGTVTDAQGQPLAGVKVRADNPNGNNIHVEGTTDANGKYKLKLTSIGGWKIYAWKEVRYMDNTYILRLGMKNDTDYDAFATEDKALVRDFVWKLSGRIPDRPARADYTSGYFGGSILFVNVNRTGSRMPDGTKVTVTLTPVNGTARNVDGTPATTITKTFTIVSGVGQSYYIGDIPLAHYRMTVTSELNGVSRNVKLAYMSTSSEWNDWFEFVFDPIPLSTGSYESGLTSGTDTPFYME